MSKQYSKKKTDHELWARWASIKNRCDNPDNKAYYCYGGRGISYDPRWADFWTFVDDIEREIGPVPFKGAFLDRINNDGDHEPGNMRWANAKISANDRRNSFMITGLGQTHSLSEWASITGIPSRTLWSRLKDQNLTIEQAIKKGHKK